MANETKIQETKKSGNAIEQVVDPGNALQPDVDIVEDSEGMTLYVDLPGVPTGVTKVEVDENNILTLRAKNAFQEPPGEIFRQARIGDYYRAFQLGSEFDRSRISAQLKDGVLAVRIPKKEAARTQRIEIQA